MKNYFFFLVMTITLVSCSKRNAQTAEQINKSSKIAVADKPTDTSNYYISDSSINLKSAYAADTLVFDNAKSLEYLVAAQGETNGVIKLHTLKDYKKEHYIIFKNGVVTNEQHEIIPGIYHIDIVSMDSEKLKRHYKKMLKVTK